jgi:hypothetical protein
METLVVEEIIKKVRKLPNNLQRQVLIFVNALEAANMRGKPGKDLLHLAGSITSKDAAKIEQAIEEGYERIDLAEW